MASNTSNNTDMLSALPAELRQIVWEMVLGDNGLLGSHRTSRGRDLIRRVVSNDAPTDEYPLHSLFYVNRFTVDRVRRLWQQTFNGRLQVDSRLTNFPPQMFDRIINLSLSMLQAAETLQVTVPHLHPNYGYWYLPTTQLVLAHGPSVQHLELHWDVPFSMNNPFDQSLRSIQATLVRLQYFQRPFGVTVHFRAYVPTTPNRQLCATGTIEDSDNANLQTFTVHCSPPRGCGVATSKYHLPTRPSRIWLGSASSIHQR